MCKENITETFEHKEYSSILEEATQNNVCGSWHWKLDKDANMAFSGGARARVQGGVVGAADWRSRLAYPVPFLQTDGLPRG